MFVGHELKNLEKEYPELDLASIEVTFDYKLAWSEGIRMFPALKIEKDILSGVFLTRKAIRKFVEDHLHQ